MLASSALKGGGNRKSVLELGVERRISLPPHPTPGDRQLVRELVLGQEEDGEEERRRAQAQQDRAGVGRRCWLVRRPIPNSRPRFPFPLPPRAPEAGVVVYDTTRLLFQFSLIARSSGSELSGRRRLAA